MFQIVFIKTMKIKQDFKSTNYNEKWIKNLIKLIKFDFTKITSDY